MAKLTLTQFFDRIETALRPAAGAAERKIDGDQGGLWWSRGENAAGVDVTTEDPKGAVEAIELRPWNCQI